MSTTAFYFINGGAGVYPVLDQVMLFITNPVIIIGCVWYTIWLFLRLVQINDPHRKLHALGDVIFFITSIFFVYELVSVCKAVIAFPRPAQLVGGVRTLLSYGDFDSFPSMHAAIAAMLAYILTVRHAPKYWYLWCGTAVLVALSRIYVGVHFPLDTLVGFAIGLAVPLLLQQFTVRYLHLVSR